MMSTSADMITCCISVVLWRSCCPLSLYHSPMYHSAKAACRAESGRRLLGDRSSWQHTLAGSRVKQHLISDRTMSGLSSLLQDTATPQGRTFAAKALGKLAGSHNLSTTAVAAALPHLFNLLQDVSNPEGRIQAAFALGRYGSIEAACRIAGLCSRRVKPLRP